MESVKPIEPTAPTDTNLTKTGTIAPANSSIASSNPPRLDLFDAAISAKARDRSLLMPFADLVQELTDYEKQQVDPTTGFAMTIEQVTVDMPVELKIEANPDGTVQTKGCPPTQSVQTTVMPVFHQVKLRVVREDDE
jgi:hypothetical protein